MGYLGKKRLEITTEKVSQETIYLKSFMLLKTLMFPSSTLCKKSFVCQDLDLLGFGALVKNSNNLYLSSKKNVSTFTNIIGVVRPKDDVIFLSTLV